MQSTNKSMLHRVVYDHGAVLPQLHDDIRRPIVYALHTLSKAESRYAQIEKEALAFTWSRDQFSEFVLGKVI